jgi:hypothetical protein
VKFCPFFKFFLVWRKLPFFGQNCSLPHPWSYKVSSLLHCHCECITKHMKLLSSCSCSHCVLCFYPHHLSLQVLQLMSKCIRPRVCVLAVQHISPCVVEIVSQFQIHKTFEENQAVHSTCTCKDLCVSSVNLFNCCIIWVFMSMYEWIILDNGKSDCINWICKYYGGCYWWFRGTGS